MINSFHIPYSKRR